MRPPFWPVLLIAALGTTLLLAGCDMAGDGDASASGSNTPAASTSATPTPTPTPSPTATPRPTPRSLSPFLSTPTPTPALDTGLSTSEVAQIVYLRVRNCADQLGTSGSRIELSLTSDYLPDEKQWRVGVTGSGGALTFGEYTVSDETGEVAPEDATAAVLLQPGVVCAQASTVLSKGAVPPQFAMAAAPSPAPVIDSGSRAELEVWVRVYSCYSTFPELSNFIAYEQGDGKWVVEGKSNTTQYGLWQVDGMSGNISPMDRLALQAAAECSLSTSSSFPPAVLGAQAELRVWAAVYDCYNQPRRTSFSSYADSPQRWLVEGRQEAVIDPVTGTIIIPSEFYGVWVVDAVDGAIRPWDGEANGELLLPCFKAL